MKKRNKYWSDWMKKARKELGLTQLELAREFARREGEKSLDTISKERVSKVEHGATTLSLPMYLEICEMLIEKRYQDRQKLSEQNRQFYKAPEILEDTWWDILKWYEEYELLSEQQGSTEAYQYAKEQIAILQKEIEQKDKDIANLHRDIVNKQEMISKLEIRLERKLQNKYESLEREIELLKEEHGREFETYTKNKEGLVRDLIAENKRLAKKIKKYKKREKERYKIQDGQITLFPMELSDREKVEILIEKLIKNDIKVPECCKL